MSTTIVFAKTEKNPICDGLRAITRALAAKDPKGVCWGVMGGVDGYGHEHVGVVFEMHPHTEEPPDCDCGHDDACGDLWHQLRSKTKEEREARISEFRANNPHLPRCADKPNFRHHRTGVEVRWHKWIGRSVEVWGEPSAELWAEIVAECLAEVNA